MTKARLFLSVASLVMFCVALASPVKAAGNHLDYDFSDDGKLTTNFGNPLTSENPEDWGRDAAFQSDGKLVVVGTTTEGGDFDFALVRYREDGTLDPTFGTDGKVIDERDGWQFAASVAIQEDGKIVIAGYSTVNSANWNWTLVRLYSNFNYDLEFGTNSVVTTDFAGGIDTTREVVVQGDRLLVGGTCWTSVLVRISRSFDNLGDGSIDHFFAGSGYGKAIANFSGAGEDRVRAMSCVSSRCVLAGDTSLSGGRVAAASVPPHRCGHNLADFWQTLKNCLHTRSHSKKDLADFKRRKSGLKDS